MNFCRSEEDNVKPMNVYGKVRLEKSKICISLRSKSHLYGKILFTFIDTNKNSKFSRPFLANLIKII